MGICNLQEPIINADTGEDSLEECSLCGQMASHRELTVCNGCWKTKHIRGCGKKSERIDGLLYCATVSYLFRLQSDLQENKNGPSATQEEAEPHEGI